MVAVSGGAKGILKARLSLMSSPWPRAGSARSKGSLPPAPPFTQITTCLLARRGRFS